MRQTPKIVLSLVVSLAACGPRTEAPVLPGLALGSSAEAQTDFRPLLKRWASALTRDERSAIAGDLARFLAKHPSDGLCPAAEALLGWVAVERGDLVPARKLGRRASTLGAGSWQDFATLIDGAIRRRRGDARSALDTLKPLTSKLIDPWARDLLNEELIAAAISAPDASLAVKMMGVWLREAGDDERALVRSRVERALATLGTAELVQIFDEYALKRGKTPHSEIDLLLAQRLAVVAIATRDAVLAQKLLFTSGALLGDRGDPIARLAADAAAIRVDARTVGLLLSFRTTETRRRSAEVAAGVVWGLELPGSAARLAMRDDAGELERLDDALTELGRDGAAVVIAGVADEDARVAAAFAEEQHVPVILITPVASTPVASTPVASTPVASAAVGAGSTAVGPGRGGAAPDGGVGSFVFPLGASVQSWKLPGEAVLKPWIAAHGAPPSFWSAAGRDAAVMALRSVKDLPQAATEDRAEVEARRLTVRTALGLTTDGLWTLDVRVPLPGPNPPP